MPSSDQNGLNQAYQEFALVYDEMMRELDYPAWVEYVLYLYKNHHAFSERAPVRSLLDLACGTGSFMALMKEKGWKVTGVDQSPSMLAIAEDKLGQTKGEYRLFAQDIRELDLDEQFSLITCLCDSLNYLLLYGDLQQVLVLIYQHLLPGGIAIADFNTEYKYREILGDNTFCAVFENSAYIWANYLEPAGRLCRMEIDFFAREKGELFRHFRETHWQRWYEPDEIKEAARNAGFTQVRCFSAFTHQPCLPEDERIFFVFTREE
ncbi:MAG TPA: class I SAM-dependent methyltransferase [Hydrogenispora sp.]|jgi:SAM-dependent methyltransferase|nr:class I SAM-dependent methyltransferase [Hydrogenispora sp.]